MYIRPLAFLLCSMPIHSYISCIMYYYYANLSSFSLTRSLRSPTRPYLFLSSLPFPFPFNTSPLLPSFPSTFPFLHSYFSSHLLSLVRHSFFPSSLVLAFFHFLPLSSLISPLASYLSTFLPSSVSTHSPGCGEDRRTVFELHSHSTVFDRYGR